MAVGSGVGVYEPLKNKFHKKSVYTYISVYIPYILLSFKFSNGLSIFNSFNVRVLFFMRFSFNEYGKIFLYTSV